MGQRVLIVGSGPAAVAAALAAPSTNAPAVTVLDIGQRLEPAHDEARVRMAAAPPQSWTSHDLTMVSTLPAAAERGLPEKRTYGSDYPFRDVGQRSGVDAPADINRAVVTGAYGGFSNVWGAQVMPFSDATFETWPVSAQEMRPHYARILREIPFAAEYDDLASLFPLLAPSHDLPPLAARSSHTLDRYNAIAAA